MNKEIQILKEVGGNFKSQCPCMYLEVTWEENAKKAISSETDFILTSPCFQ